MPQGGQLSPLATPAAALPTLLLPAPRPRAPNKLPADRIGVCKAPALRAAREKYGQLLHLVERRHDAARLERRPVRVARAAARANAKVAREPPAHVAPL